MNNIWKQMWSETPIAFKLAWVLGLLLSLGVSGLIIILLIKLIAKL